MKQHITIDQLSELSEKQTDRLLDYFPTLKLSPYNSKENICNTLTIGRMIELLGDGWIEEIRYVTDTPDVRKLSDSFDDIYFPRNSFLCDALWEAVKEVLEAT